MPDYATPKVTKCQRCNFIIQIHQFTIKIDKINISLSYEYVKIVEFNFKSHVFHVMYQETRFLNQDACFLNQEGRRQLLISFVSERDSKNLKIEELGRRIIRSAQEGVNTFRTNVASNVSTPDEELRRRFQNETRTRHDEIGSIRKKAEQALVGALVKYHHRRAER